MKPWFPRHPARPGLTCAPLAESAAPADCAARIQEVMGERGRVVRLGEASSSGEGFYRLDSKKKGARFFVKLITSGQAERQQRADGLAQHAATDGLGVSLLLAGYPRSYDALHALLVYDFVEGHPPASRREELRLLGKEVARLHASMAKLPWAAKVRREAAERGLLLARRQRALAEGQSAAGPEPARLRAHMSSWPGDFSAEDATSQVIHGDLNPGNLLLCDDGRVVFLDFEDSLLAWLPVRVDLAMIVERLILAPIERAADAVALGREFLSAYCAESGRSAFAEPGDLARSLYWLALRSLCLLAEFEAQGTPWPQDEWHKFFWLLELAERRRSVIAAIEAAFVAKDPAGLRARA